MCIEAINAYSGINRYSIILRNIVYNKSLTLLIRFSVLTIRPLRLIHGVPRIPDERLPSLQAQYNTYYSRQYVGLDEEQYVLLLTIRLEFGESISNIYYEQDG